MSTMPIGLKLGRAWSGLGFELGVGVGTGSGLGLGLGLGSGDEEDDAGGVEAGAGSRLGLEAGAHASASPIVKKTMPVTSPADARYSRKEYFRPSSRVPTWRWREVEGGGGRWREVEGQRRWDRRPWTGTRH